MKYEEKLRTFEAPADEFRPMYYFDFPPIDDALRTEKIKKTVDTCLRAGCGTLIPRLSKGTRLPDMAALDVLRDMYTTLLTAAREADLKVGFFLDHVFEETVIGMMDDIGETALHARTLECKEYYCRASEELDRRLHEDTLLSLVAYSEAYGEVIDLRPFVKNGRLLFTVPQGNWVVREYYAPAESDCHRANYLSYEASYTYIRTVFGLFAEVFAPFLGTTLTILAYAEIGFHGMNRRNWDASFNKIFIGRYGFDPAPYYPALFSYMGEDTRHYRTMLMAVRASMLEQGVLRALQDFATVSGLRLFGTLTEPKLTACSFTVGDAMLASIHAPTALFDKAYLYGTNSVKIMAGTAYNFDLARVGGEFFRDYLQSDRISLYKDAMNAFARGVNDAAFHLPPTLTENSDFGDFTARVQAMLRGGRHVADIALLYPIYDLHSRVTLYDSPTESFEYPETAISTNYMTLINAISFYAGHDLTVLHPTVMSERCHTEGGVLYLDNQKNREQFRIVVLPATEIISLPNLRLLKKFYDEGGKILATGVLPTMAFEYDKDGKNDAEVCRLTREIFGKEATDKRVMRRYCHSKNQAGGEAIFLYFNATAVTGIHMVKSSTVNSALNTFSIPFDIYIPGMQRFEGTGALNAIYPEFHTVGLDRSFPDGGMVNHIHKASDGGDVFYFANTSDVAYNHHVLLRGAHTVSECNPHTGTVSTPKSRLLSYLGEVYTYLRLNLPAQASVFFLTVPRDTEGEEIPAIDSISRLESAHASLISEF